MPLHDPRSNLSLELRSLGWVVMVLTAAFLFILWPFLGAVLWAVAIAIAFEPVHARVREQTGQRSTLAAMLTLALILLIVILPLILVGAAVVQEAASAVKKVRAGEVNFGQYLQLMVAALPEWVRSLLDRLGLMDLAALQQQLTSLLAGSGQFITTHLLGLGQNTLDFVVALFVMLYLLFFLLRDGRTLTHRIAQTLPLREDHAHRLLLQFVTVVRATVKGNILIALVQGLLGGIAFAVLGLPGALLWGTLMALLSLLPAVGAVLVWGPVAAWLLFGFLGAYPIQYMPLLARSFPPQYAGRVSTSCNLVVFTVIFGGQWAIGRVVDLWPRTATGYAPDGYAWSFGLLFILQVAGLLWLFLSRARPLLHERPPAG